MPVARSRRQSLHIARVQPEPEVQAWSQRSCGLLSFRVSTFSYSDDPRTRARRLRAVFLIHGVVVVLSRQYLLHRPPIQLQLMH
jgi:hypothetical protein